MKVIMANKGRKFFTILLIITLIIIIVLLGYLAYRFLSNYLIQKEASEAVDEFENSIITVAIDDENVIDETQNQQIQNQQTQTPVSSNSSGTRYRGYNVIGTIQIPKTKVKYPIVDSTTPQAMEVAIVMLYGPGLNEVGNTVIVGHNYRNGGFFGNNSKLELGDKIYITDISGNKIEYTIYNKYITADTDFSYATRDTNGSKEISLSTCTSDNSKRLVIWGKET